MFGGSEGFDGKEQLQMRGRGREALGREANFSTAAANAPPSVEMTMDGRDGRRPDGGLDDRWGGERKLRVG
jgi:hypothetical protein